MTATECGAMIGQSVQRWRTVSSRARQSFHTPDEGSEQYIAGAAAVGVRRAASGKRRKKGGERSKEEGLKPQDKIQVGQAVCMEKGLWAERIEETSTLAGVRLRGITLQSALSLNEGCCLRQEHACTP